MPWVPELFTAPALQSLEEKRHRKFETVPFFDGILTGELDALIGSFAGEPELYHPVRGRIRGRRAFEAYVADTLCGRKVVAPVVMVFDQPGSYELSVSSPASLPACTANGPVTFDQHFAYRRICFYLHPVRGGGLRHGLRNGAHAANGVAPQAPLAVDLPEGMVQQHIGGARRVGACIIPDDGVEAEQCPDEFTLEPAIQVVAR